MGKLDKAVAYLKKNGLGRTVGHICYKLTNSPEKLSKLSPEQYERALKAWYRDATGEKLDLDNPKTFNEKIQWLKLYDSTPLKTRLADKYLVREWVKEKIGEKYLIPLLGVWDSFDEIDFDQLPDQFVLKANHGSGWNLIVRDKSKLDKEEAKRKFDDWMNRDYAFEAGFELHYSAIPRKIIAEEYLSNGADGLCDYKFFCFDGKADSVEFMSERERGVKVAFYNLEWKKALFTRYQPMVEHEIPKPKYLEDMIRLAQVLSEGFSFVRVDFYVLNDGRFKFGEMTFTPASGVGAWNPPEQGLIYGDMIRLPRNTTTKKTVFKVT